MSLWLAITASAGTSLSVGIRVSEIFIRVAYRKRANLARALLAVTSIKSTGR
jgi:hypothetical protein